MKLEKLYEQLELNIKNGRDIVNISEKINYFEEFLFEDTSATGGPAGSIGGGDVGGSPMANASISGMGDVVNPQPASQPGLLNGPGWDGTIGSGDISAPYNAMGVSMKQSMGKSHGSMTGKKSRTKPLDINKLKSALKSFGKSAGKIKSFTDFDRDSVDRVNKVQDIKK